MSDIIQEIIDRADLSDSQKIGILIEQYALKPGESQKVEEPHAKKIVTLTEKEGDTTFQCEGYYTKKNKKDIFVKHGSTLQICNCSKCNGKTTLVLRKFENEELTKELCFRHGSTHQNNPKIVREYIGKTQTSEDIYFKDGTVKSRWYISGDNANIRIYKKYHPHQMESAQKRERVKFEGVRIKVNNVFVKDGEVRWVYQSGRIKRTGKYNQGKKIGEWKTVYPTGEKKKIIKYNKNGDAIGNLKEWYLSGQLKRKENMMLNGIGVWYHKNGQIECTGKFNKSGWRHGKWVYYNENGKETEVIHYKNGLKHGQYVKKTKKKVVDGTYRKGKKVGEWFIEY